MNAAKTVPVVAASKKHDILQERVHDQTTAAESGSGAVSDPSSGDAMSGSDESESGSDDFESGNSKEKMNDASKITSSKNLHMTRNKIWHIKVPKIDLGDFVLPVKKNAIPVPQVTTVLNLHKNSTLLHSEENSEDDSDDSGSGSGSGGSGDEDDSDEPKPEVKHKEAKRKFCCVRNNIIIEIMESGNQGMKRCLSGLKKCFPRGVYKQICH